RAASGVCNPITGRRLVKTWLADQIFPYLHSFYQTLEKRLESQFFFPRQVYRTFDSIKAQNDWFQRGVEQGWEKFTEDQIDHSQYSSFVDNSFGGWETRQAAFIFGGKMMDAQRAYLQERGLFQEENLQYEDLTVESNGVIWKDWQARYLVFCEGARLRFNPYFNYLPLWPDKGEWLKIKIPGGHLENMIKQNVFIIPLGEETFLVSGTYHKGDLSYAPTEKARAELSQKLDRVLKLPYEIIEQRAGIRGATRDRRPFIGAHPQYPSLLLFNGFGTKGLSLSPYFAQQLLALVDKGEAIHPEADIKRFEKFWYPLRGEWLLLYPPGPIAVGQNKAIGSALWYQSH
ncbi:MAG: FAD-binding oxidoreductase, partial [Bacteroidota bacterium]